MVALAATTVATAAATRIAATTTQRLVNVLRISSASLRPRPRTCRIVIDVSLCLEPVLMPLSI